ncbi:hypothetical protein VOLCADRAFT_97251 [Volvox carteri f. nagariensis]|uniref:Uncharacterized protein n=1 Tax=Volvox carteri f. nagariensis TaxID=3068 RepID=D8UC92_VOLCA|nr:uncharacterized protein VOLCADRAFT_97251 [Volvox carteri f. nagariensis]EFJ42604.1 hypothetical protein VOLCADRAFT_97251 [Volvox carteri f. nagariensis]|eukprot:XP_002956255.1 hypothetical protein VOLCADRAFT_97251 [Volvox carteri f. nagariensis]
MTVPEPIPEASTLPEEPPLRSEQIDLTLAIKRCRTWQELRRLYWANRTRHGVINMVSYFTRLAALAPSLPELLLPYKTDDTDEAAVEEAEAAAAAGGADGQVVAALAGATPVSWSGKGYDAPRRRSQQQQQQPQQQQQQQQRQQQAGLKSGRGKGPAATTPPARCCSIAERTALRQLVVRMVYDACW